MPCLPASKGPQSPRFPEAPAYVASPGPRTPRTTLESPQSGSSADRDSPGSSPDPAFLALSRGSRAPRAMDVRPFQKVWPGRSGRAGGGGRAGGLDDGAARECTGRMRGPRLGRVWAGVGGRRGRAARQGSRARVANGPAGPFATRHF